MVKKNCKCTGKNEANKRIIKPKPQAKTTSANIVHLAEDPLPEDKKKD